MLIISILTLAKRTKEIDLNLISFTYKKSIHLADTLCKTSRNSNYIEERKMKTIHQNEKKTNT